MMQRRKMLMPVVQRWHVCSEMHRFMLHMNIVPAHMGMVASTAADSVLHYRMHGCARECSGVLCTGT
jgi:hypothetical protein